MKPSDLTDLVHFEKLGLQSYHTPIKSSLHFKWMKTWDVVSTPSSRLDDVTYGSFIAQFGYKNKVEYIRHCVHYTWFLYVPF